MQKIPDVAIKYAYWSAPCLFPFFLGESLISASVIQILFYELMTFNEK
jgi:hypothetical protein